MSSAEQRTPLRIWSQAISPRLFLLSLVAALPVVTALGKLNEGLQNAIAPQGVVSFELAHRLARQNQILGSWDQRERLTLAFSIGLDFFCVVAFLGALAIACLWLAEASRQRGLLLSKLGTALAWALGTMAAFWMLQNVLLAAALFGHRTEGVAQVIYWCALLKFAVITISLAYVGLVGIALLLSSLRPGTSIAR